MKLKIIVLMLCGVAGMGASYAFASGGGPHGQSNHCRRTLVFGTVSAPQTFTVTVTRSSHHKSLSGKTVNVSLGSSGQTVRFSAVGCVGSDGTLTVRGALLDAVNPRGGHGDGNGGTTTNDNGGTTTTDNGGTTTTHDAGTTTTHDGGTTTTQDGGTTTSTTANP